MYDLYLCADGWSLTSAKLRRSDSNRHQIGYEPIALPLRHSAIKERPVKCDSVRTPVHRKVSQKEKRDKTNRETVFINDGSGP